MANRVRWRGDENSSRSDSRSFRNSDSDRSDHSYSTAPTVYSLKPQPQRHETCDGRLQSCHAEQPFASFDNARTSVETYASTVPSEEDEYLDDDAPEYEEFLEERSQFDPVQDAIPSTPKDFGHLFPSARRLLIRHDNSTIDGNMQLRVDTEVEPSWSTKKLNYTLFHLRMKDLRTREFSLRRYCRDSGREVSNSIRKYHTPASDSRPALQKSFSSAFATFRRPTSSNGHDVGGLKRSDSGYGSIHDEGEDRRAQHDDRKSISSRMPTNTIKLEFSNYAHVDVKRRGTASGKRYEFEYWGFSYAWKRHVTQDGSFEEVSYHLMRNDKSRPVAYIVPVPLTTTQAEEEREKGGWIPPCSMWIRDEDILNALPDVAEYVPFLARSRCHILTAI
jgi:hypothetical protein